MKSLATTTPLGQARVESFAQPYIANYVAFSMPVAIVNCAKSTMLT